MLPEFRSSAPSRAPGPVEFIGLIALLTSLTAISIDALLPALRAMELTLGVEDGRDLQLVITLFIAGMVIGEILFGPISDAFGRKPAVLAGLALYLVGTVLAMSADAFAQVLIGRVVQGIGAAGPKIAIRALVRDLYAGDEMARVMSLVFTVMIFMPMLAPLVGQLALDVAGWRGVFALYLLAASVGALWLAMRQPETLVRARRIPLDVRVLRGNAITIVRDRTVMAYTVAAGVVFGAFLLYLGTAQAVFLDVYGVSRRFPLWFALLSVSIGLSAFANGRAVRRFGARRLSLLALTAMVASSALFTIVALATAGRPPFAFYIVCSFCLFGSLGTLFGNLNALAMRSLGHVAGIGASLVSSISSAVAVALAVVLGRFHDGTVTLIGAGFLIAAVSAFVLVWWTGSAERPPGGGHHPSRASASH